MSYALVINGTLTNRGPGYEEIKISDSRPLSPPRTGWTDELAALCGFVPIVDTARPTDTTIVTYDRSVTLVAGVPTVQWTQRPKTQPELDADKAVSNEATIGTYLADAIATGGTLDVIIGTAALSLTQADLRTLQQQVKDLARIERRLVKKLLRLLDTAT